MEQTAKGLTELKNIDLLGTRISKVKTLSFFQVLPFCKICLTIVYHVLNKYDDNDDNDDDDDDDDYHVCVCDEIFSLMRFVLFCALCIFRL